ncbi:MAG: hypothetical protein NVS9B5_18340 [Terriglobales bacterium]
MAKNVRSDNPGETKKEDFNFPPSSVAPRHIENDNSKDLLATASDPSLKEDAALLLLKRAELPSGAFERLSKNAAVVNSRKVKVALLGHQRAPRHISLPMLAHLFTFDLMQVALQPAIAADIKVAAENTLMNRLEKLSAGEKLSLARRASGRVASRLLLDPEPRVLQAALENSRLTEAFVIKAIFQRDVRKELIDAVSEHPKWSLSREIRAALLRSKHTSDEKAFEFAADIPLPQLQEILQDSELPHQIQSRLIEGR